MKSYLRFLWVCLALAVFLASIPYLVMAQEPVDELVITEIEESDFPQINLAFRALNDDGDSVGGLTVDEVFIMENDKAMQVESLEETSDGVWVHLIIDAGAGMAGDRWTSATETIRDYLQTNSGMRDGIDHVALSAIEASGLRVLTGYTASSDELLSALEDYTPPRGSGFSAPLVAAQDILEQLDANEDADDQAKYAVLVTPGFESEQEFDELVQQARSLSIPVHTILVRSAPRIPCPAPVTNNDGSVTQGACDEVVRDLSIATGGEFAHFADRESLNRLLENMANNRRQYQLSYRSNQGQSGTRQVSLATPSMSSPDAIASTSYTVEVNPIRVLIDAPRIGENIVREAAAFTEDRGSIPPTSYTVVASPIFPDVRRRILQAELLVNGSVVSDVDFPGETIELPWNLRGITQLGVNEQTLQVRILDELGLESVSQPANVDVEVVVPPQPTVVIPPDVVATIIPQITPAVVVPTPIPCTLPDALCPAEQAMRGNWLAATSMGIALLALAFAGVVWVNRDKAPVRAATASITKAVERITKPRGKSKALAHLKILAGEANLNRMLAIHGTTRLGRSRSDADLLFRQDDENPVVSRIHCTIKDVESHFEIIDEGSTHGTYLNGSKLLPLVAERLNHEDEIELGLVEAGGVKLQFLLAEEEEMGDGLQKTRRTRKEAPGPDNESSSDEVPPF